MSGWTCSYRKIWEHPIFVQSAERVGVWTWMIHTAVWKDTPFRVGTTVIKLKRGQLCVSQRQIEAETGVGRQKVRTLLAELEAEGAITQQSTHGATQGRTIITICKYDEYQSRETSPNPANNHRPTQEKPTKEQDKQSNNPLPSEEAFSAPVQVSVASTAVWNAGKQYLNALQVKNPGSIIGRWLKSHSATALLSAIEAAQQSGTRDPVPYITSILNKEGKQNERSVSKSAQRLNAFVSGARGSS